MSELRSGVADEQLTGCYLRTEDSSPATNFINFLQLPPSITSSLAQDKAGVGQDQNQ